VDTSSQDSLTAAQLSALDAVSCGGPAKFHQMHVSPELLKRILDAGRREHSDQTEVVLVDAGFDGSVFDDVAAFSGVRFEGNASFSGAEFTTEALFNGVTFGGDARFDNAKFSQTAHFGGAKFNGGCWFAGVTFEANAMFNGGHVDGTTVFDGATFSGTALFMRRDFRGHATFEFEATFEQVIRFDETSWQDGVAFTGTRFSGETRFFGATLSGACSFAGAKFGAETNFAAARFDCTELLLDDVTFPDRLAIAGRAHWLSCKGTRFLNGASIRLDGVAADLTEAEFARPSALSGRGLSVLSMKGAYVRDLTLAGADLSRCRFVGAQSLDELSVGDAHFASSPAGWRWSARDVIVEECFWRAHTQKRQEWQVAVEPTELERRFVADMIEEEARGELADARQIAVAYRELRKGKEDSKDEPGAAGLYYGEMEMRRHVSRPRTGGVTSLLGFWAERGILWAYWLVSGYALRASRALFTLAITILGCSALLHWFGFSPRVSFSRAVLLGTESSSSLLRPAQPSKDILTAGGQVVDIALRVLGPLFLGLFLLSLRGRVKR
jgi:uncharacterized protein YjbI with pentapeptide repeats